MQSKSSLTQSDSFKKAKGMLPEDLWPVLGEFIEHYKFSALKHHGHRFVSPVVLAELILLGWRQVSIKDRE